MNGILLLLPVFLPLVLGLLSYFLPIRSESCRRLVYSLLILGTTALAWAAILLCDDGAFTLLHFSTRLTIAFRMDGAARLFAGLSATLWPFTMLYGFDYMRHEKHLHMFWAFFTASFGVTLGIAFSANMMTMYLFYELLTLATLPLVMQPMTRAAKKAGIKYLVYSISGAALAFIGLVFLAIHDAVDFTLGGHLAGYDGDMSMLLAVFALSFVGFGVKAAIWPLHGWLPSAAVAPTPVTALLHAVAVVKAGAFACIRLIYYSFGPDILSGTWAQQLALLLPIITIVYGSCMSLKQRHFKLRLAYSTVSNLSYILFAAALMTTQALAASFLHLIVHSVVKIMAFFTAGAVLHYAHREYVPQLEGLGRYMPVTFACFTAAACALTGIPPFNGFVSNPWRPVIWLVVFLLATHFIIIKGVEKGIEKSAKIMMPMLFILLVVLAICSVSLPGASAGIEFLLKPDFSKVDGNVFLGAMGQAFFSLSLGMGCLCTYASYFRNDTNLPKTALNVAGIDTLVAILAGFIIFPAAFSVGIQPDAGPSLLFITLPNVFQQAFGNIPWLAIALSIMFYVLLALAALTSTISLHEVVTAYLHEEFKFTRGKAAKLVTAGCIVLGVLCSLSLGVGKSYTIFGLNLFDLFDFVTAKIMLPLGGFFISIFTGWYLDKKIVWEEVSNNGTLNIHIYRLLIFILKYIAPIGIGLIFINELGFFK